MAAHKSFLQRVNCYIIAHYFVYKRTILVKSEKCEAMVVLLFIHISSLGEGYDFEVLVEPVKPPLHGDIARSPVG